MINKIKDIFRRSIAKWSALFYGNPSRKMTVIGVTGTKGKTTTVELIGSILEAAGKKTVILSSVHYRIAGEDRLNPTPNTMYGRGRIQKILREALDMGCEYAVIEVSSQGVVRHIHEAIEWDGALLINIHPEHIESHGSFENYREAKLDFFRYVAASPKPRRMFFINRDDNNRDMFAEAAGDNEKYFFGGTFIKANYAAAFEVGRALGISEEIIQKALNDFPGLAGRMEMVQEEPFKVVVDYAHTPDSLEEVYKFLGLGLKIKVVGNEERRGRLICVLGSAGGGRDRWKRPKMGEAAGKYCDEIIVTNEDPYDEDPISIMDEVAKGAESMGKEVYRILDREEAIDKAIALALPGDAVVMTGKGSEKCIHLSGGRKLAWSDKEVAEKSIKDKEPSEASI
ncbi:MAG: Mur ligase family protein [Candidatus Colwellbacteria bacterium]|nr:Mur ligase family protein [Candidatus Colwellbacteria bacterium]